MIKLIPLLLVASSVISGIGVASTYHQDGVTMVLSSILAGLSHHVLNNPRKYFPKRKGRKSKRKGIKSWLLNKIGPIVRFMIVLFY